MKNIKIALIVGTFLAGCNSLVMAGGSLHIQQLEYPQGELVAPERFNWLYVLVGSTESLDADQLERISIVVSSGDFSRTFPEPDNDRHPIETTWLRREDNVFTSYLYMAVDDLSQLRADSGDNLHIEVVVEGEEIEGLSAWCSIVYKFW